MGFKVVRIDWLDASGDGEWMSKRDFDVWADDPSCICTSAGFLIAEDSSHYILLQSVNEDQVSGRLSIPKSVVLNIQELAETDINI